MPLFVRQNADSVEAVQWFPGQPVAGIADEWPGHPGSESLLPSPAYAYLTTSRGRFTVFAGDWIITEPNGEQHLCHDALFRQGYQQVKEKPAEVLAEPALLKNVAI